MVGTAYLLIFVIIVHFATAAADVRKLPMCDVAMFRDSKIIVMNRYGMLWADGNQSSIEELNRKFERPESLAYLENEDKYEFIFDGAKIFYTTGYWQVLLWGFIPQVHSLNMILIDYNRTSSKFTNPKFPLYSESIWKPNGHVRSTRRLRAFFNVSYFRNEHHTKPDYQTLVRRKSLNMDYPFCDERSVQFITSEMKLIVDNAEMNFDLKQRLITTAKTLPFQSKCPDPDPGPVEKVPDFNNRLPDFQLLYFEEDRLKDEQEGNFFLNQLESGNFKLHVEVANDGTGDFYYHVLTLLNSVGIYRLREIEGGKCVIRKFKKVDKKDAVEFPRMLIIPKTTGSNVKLLTTTAEPTTIDPVELILENGVLERNTSHTNGTDENTSYPNRPTEGHECTPPTSQRENKSFFLIIGCLSFSIVGAALSALMLFLTYNGVLFRGKKKMKMKSQIDAEKTKEVSSLMG